MKILLALALVLCMTFAFASCDMLPDELRETIEGLLGTETPDDDEIDKDDGEDGEDDGSEDDCEHIPGDWFIDVYATCDTEGLRKQYCKLCWELLVEEAIPTLANHEYVFGKCKVCQHEQTESMGLAYGKDSDGNTIVIGMGDCTDTSLYISATAPDGSAVVGIKDGAFKNETGILTVIIEDGVGYIGADAFNGASALDRVKIPVSITSIGANAFSLCPISVATVPAEFSAFVSNANIVNVTLTGTKPVPEGAFRARNKLSGVTLSEGIPSIGSGAFAQTGISSFRVPDSVTYIGASAFEFCMKLKIITLGAGVETIDENAFQNCSYLEQVTITASVEYIGKRVFYRCPRLKKVMFEDTEGWIAALNASATTGDIISTETFADPELAAKYILAHDEYYFRNLS